MNTTTKKLLLAALLTTSTATMALQAGDGDTIQRLQNTPATVYDLGAARLDARLAVLGMKMNGKEIPDTGLELSSMSAFDNGERLNITTRAKGRARDINDEACRAANTGLKRGIPAELLLETAWPGLTQSDYSSLRNRLTFTMVVHAKENDAFTLSCTD